MSKHTVLNSTEMFVNMKDVPRWNPKKHYYEQSKEVLEFWELERHKMTFGVNIGGYFFHPWMYFHLNFFNTPIPTVVPGRIKPVDKSQVPTLDDLFLYIMESYQDAEKYDKGLFLFGTRGSSKSTILASNTHWTALTKPDGVHSIMGGSDSDLNAITNLVKHSLGKITPAFNMPIIRGKDWDSEVTFGIKEKTGEDLIHSVVSITNVHGGTNKKSEKGAGLSPVGYIFDEALYENELVYTEYGTKTMKEVQVGDLIFGADGNLTLVVDKIDPGIQHTWKFIFSDGREVVSSDNHLWTMYNNVSQEWVDMTTSEIRKGNYRGLELPPVSNLNRKNSTVVLDKYNNRVKPVHINDVEYAGKRQVYCIKVDNEDKLFLTTDYIPTHNCGKFEFWKAYESALPSFRTQHGYKLVPICAGTGGNEELSIDAQRVMEDPEGHEMLLCNWDRLERGVPEEYRTWTKDRDKPFGIFLPGQMSHRLDVPKVKSSVGKFLGLKHKDLMKIPIMITDWPRATERVRELTDDSIKDEASRNRNRMYYPQSTSDCFLTQSENPFPKDIIERQIRKLEERGDTGKNIELHIEDGKQKYEFSHKRRSKIKHPGGVSDAPVVAHEDPPEKPPVKGIYVAGMDGYKIDVSKTNSLGALCLIKRRNLEPNSPCETVIATYAARPEKMRYFNQTAEKVLRAWGAQCLIESVDMGFQQYLENKGVAQDYLVRTFTLSGHQGANSKLKSTYGIYPTKGNQEYMFNLTVDFTKEEHVIGIDEEGNQVIKTGVEFIEDIELLREMLTYTKGGNFDRLDAFMHALTLARELDKKNYMPKANEEEYETQRMTAEQVRERLRSNKYGSQDLRSKLSKY